MHKGQIFCGFPGVGKSTFVSRNPHVMDSDSSTFDKAHFPENYLQHIKQNYFRGRTLLVSSHAEVRTSLIEAELPFTLVYPDASCKQEYLERYIQRGSPEGFVALLEKNFEAWIKECDDLEAPNVEKVKLRSGEFMSDLLGSQ